MIKDGQFKQICREIDKWDRIGGDGVYCRLLDAGLDKFSAFRWCYFVAPLWKKRQVDEWVAKENLPPLFEGEIAKYVQSVRWLQGERQ